MNPAGCGIILKSIFFWSFKKEKCFQFLSHFIQCTEIIFSYDWAVGAIKLQCKHRKTKRGIGYCLVLTMTYFRGWTGVCLLWYLNHFSVLKRFCAECTEMYIRACRREEKNKHAIVVVIFGNSYCELRSNTVWSFRTELKWNFFTIPLIFIKRCNRMFYGSQWLSAPKLKLRGGRKRFSDGKIVCNMRQISWLAIIQNQSSKLHYCYCSPRMSCKPLENWVIVTVRADLHVFHALFLHLKILLAFRRFVRAAKRHITLFFSKTLVLIHTTMVATPGVHVRSRMYSLKTRSYCGVASSYVVFQSFFIWLVLKEWEFFFVINLLAESCSIIVPQLAGRFKNGVCETSAPNKVGITVL